MPGRCCTSAGCCGVSTRKAFSRGTWRVHWEASSSAAGLHLHHACSCSTCIRRVPDNVQQCATMCDDVRPCTTMRSKKQQNSQCCRATNLECVEESPAFFAPLAHQAEVEACNEELSVEKLLRAGCRGWPLRHARRRGRIRGPLCAEALSLSICDGLEPPAEGLEQDRKPPAEGLEPQAEGLEPPAEGLEPPAEWPRSGRPCSSTLGPAGGHASIKSVSNDGT